MRKLTLLALTTLALTLAACSTTAVLTPQPAPVTQAPTNPGTLLPKATLTLTPYPALTLTPGTVSSGTSLEFRLAGAQRVKIRLLNGKTYSGVTNGEEGRWLPAAGDGFGPLQVGDTFQASVDGVTWTVVAVYACPAAACR